MQLAGNQPRQKEQKLDSLMKRFLSYKCIISRILHYGLKEFKELTPDYIEHNCFPNSEGERVLRLNTEDIGSAQDLIFDVCIPGDEIPRTIIINLEPQTTDRLSYALVTRAIFYGSSILSRQYDTVFTNSEYQKIQKVYSIWIVTHPKKNKNVLTTYNIEQDNIVGTSTDTKRDYDLLSIIIASLGDEYTNNPLLDFLNQTFDFKKGKNEIFDTLKEKYGVSLTDQFRKDVSDMYTIEDAILEQGIQQGIEQGIKEVAINMLKAGMSKDQIAAITGLSIKDLSELERSL